MTDPLNQELRIGPDRQVTLHFALKLENGEVVDSAYCLYCNQPAGRVRSQDIAPARVFRPGNSNCH